MKKEAIILAGGIGRRAGGELPKQFVKLLGIPMLWWSVMAFHEEDSQTKITIVMHPDYFEAYERLLEELPREVRGIRVRLVAGGSTRGESVANGILALEESKNVFIAIHDAARPMITREIISRGWKCAKLHGTAVPVIPVTDTLRKIENNDSATVDRSLFRAVQTPQVFRADILKKAYRNSRVMNYTDDASVVEGAGHNLALYDGFPSNLKVTTPTDFIISQALLKNIL